MVDPKLWPTKTKEGERDWYVEARVGSENYRGQLVHFIRDWHTDEGRQYVNAKAEDVIAQLLEERDAAIRERDADAASDAILRRQYLARAEKAERERDEARAQAQKHDPYMRLERAALSERADRAEALLRECYRVVGDTDSSVLARTKLLAKIREITR